VFAQSFNSIVSLPPALSSLADFNIGGVFYPFADFTVKLTAIVLIFLLTWVNSRGH
jgi:APA family basic amino acid/polyamine antiporter